MDLLRKALAEFLGVFALVFAGCGAIIMNELTKGQITHVGISIAFGLVIMVMIYAVGHISGAHFNPAVSVAFAFTTKFSIKEMFVYIVAQCLGAIAACFLYKITLSSFFVLITAKPMIYGVTLPINDQFMTAFVFEIIATFFLMFVIMAVATDARAVGAAAGAAIGGTVLLLALFVGPISGASMNPARSLGPALMQGEWSHVMAYMLAPMTGAIIGAFVYRFVAYHRDNPI